MYVRALKYEENTADNRARDQHPSYGHNIRNNIVQATGIIGRSRTSTGSFCLGLGEHSVPPRPVFVGGVECRTIFMG